MSLNQSRSERNDSQYRKPGGGRSGNSTGGHNRPFTGGRGRGGAGPTSNPIPPPTNHRSYKKVNNAQGAQSRANPGIVSTPVSDPASGALESGGHVPPSSQGVSSTPAPAAIAKPADVPLQKTSRPLPRAPTSQSSSMNSDSTIPSTPAKGAGAKGFSLQFGSLSPGFMNGMQVPARTSSAPPNIDEQKHQARFDSSRGVPDVPVPPVPVPVPVGPKHELSKKNPALVEKPVTQKISQKTNTEPQANREVQVASASPPTQAQKSSALPLPITGISITSPYHQPSVSMQFSGPNPQNQSQGGPGSSLQIPMPLPLHIGNPSQVSQPVFVPSLQHPLMQSHGLMHQRQGLGYNPQLSTQVPHQLGNIGINMSPSYNQPPVGNYSRSRTTVKITHPETHEELRLDGRDGGLSQNQPRPTYTANPMGYYTNVYPVPSSLPMTNTQSNATVQGSRFNYPVSQANSNVPFVNQSSSTFALKSGGSKHGNADPSNADHSCDGQNMIPQAKPTSTPVTIRAPAEKISSSSVVKIEPPKLLNPNVESGTGKKDIEVSLQPKSDVGRLNQPLVTGCVPAASPLVLDTSLKNLASQQVDVESAAEVLKDLGFSSKSTVSDTYEAPIIRSSSTEGVSEAGRLLPVDTHVLQNITTAVKVSSNSSQSSDSFESQNLIEKRFKQNDAPLHEDITRASSTNQDRGEEECPLVIACDNSSNTSDALKGTNQDHQVKHIVNSGLVTESSQREADSTISDTVAESMQSQHSGVCDVLVSDNSSGILSNPNFNNDVPKSIMLDNEVMHIPEGISEAHAEHDTEIVENPRPSSSSGSVSGSANVSLDSSKTKNRGKKRLKELLQKADALGTTADLYMAYKGPEEKQESLVASEPAAEDSMKDTSSDANTNESSQESKDEKSKDELDDWEDADISSPKLESSSKGVHDEKGVTAKNYSRDFLLTISEHCTDLPEGFSIPPEVSDVLMGVSTPRSDREYPSSGRAVDRPGVTRPDRRGNGTMEADRWNKQPGQYLPVQDPRMDLAYASNSFGFDGGRGPHGVLRNRPQGPNVGILSGPMHPLGFQGGPMNNSNADRWQRGANFNRGVVPSPHTQGPVIHKAERKYEVGKITDEEQAKQRKLKGILNKLTPQNFERLFEQVKEVNIDNVITLSGVISQIFDKALTEPTFCEMYANFCQHLASELPGLSVDDEKITFRRLLLNKCQEEFERGEREEQEANNVDGEGDAEQSEAVREEKRVKARRRMLGNIRLIGELYKKRMLTERIMHECIKKLLGQYQNPDEENIEALCKLMSTIGEMIDHPKAKEHMDAYFDIMRQLSINMKLSSRVRFMLKDAIDLRKNKWQQRRKVDGPKKIEEVHRDAAQERRGQVAQLNRGPSMSPATRRGPLEFGARGSMLPSQIGPGMGFRGMPPQGRGFGGQDMRIDERNSYESRTLSMPMPQRLSSDEPITLGPQGGLAKGMAFRGQPSVSSSPIIENFPSFGDPRRMGGGLNGYGTPPERGAYSTREDQFTRNASDRFGSSVVYDQSNNQERNSIYMNREVRCPDRNSDRSRPTTPIVTGAGAGIPENKSFENVRSEEQLRDMSLAAIKEFYSAKDEKEVALCIKDLNAPSFYPTVVSIWVSDSFERKNFEQDLLAKLLVSLTKPHDGTFSPIQLIQGFESVLTDLEDTVTDAPKAPEFLGRILAKVVMENVLPLKDVGQIIQDGGEEAGRLIEVGLAGEVVASLLEMIKSEKGESAVKEIRASCNLQLENFRPPHPTKCHKLEMFI